MLTKEHIEQMQECAAQWIENGQPDTAAYGVRPSTLFELCTLALRALSAAPQPERNDMPLRDGGFANATFEGIPGSVHSDRRTHSPMEWDKQERRGVTWTEDAAAPNNAAQQGDFAAAQQGGPDRASGDRGTHDLEVKMLMIERLNAQADHIDQNAAALRRWADTEHEARCRELCASYLREMASTIRVELTLSDMARAAGLGDEYELQTASSANGNAVAGESPDARDAARYRHLRTFWPVSLMDGLFDGCKERWRAGHELDAAVDAAMGSPTDDEERK